jgi:hypothetical protein
MKKECSKGACVTPYRIYAHYSGSKMVDTKILISPKVVTKPGQVGKFIRLPLVKLKMGAT